MTERCPYRRRSDEEPVKKHTIIALGFRKTFGREVADHVNFSRVMDLVHDLHWNILATRDMDSVVDLSELVGNNILVLIKEKIYIQLNLQPNIYYLHSSWVSDPVFFQ